MKTKWDTAYMLFQLSIDTAFFQDQYSPDVCRDFKRPEVYYWLLFSWLVCTIVLFTLMISMFSKTFDDGYNDIFENWLHEISMRILR